MIVCHNHTVMPINIYIYILNMYLHILCGITNVTLPIVYIIDNYIQSQFMCQLCHHEIKKNCFPLLVRTKKYSNVIYLSYKKL